MKECAKHGLVPHVAEKQNSTGYVRHRCKQCGYERQLKNRRLKKQKLVESAGGKCEACGYDKYHGALDFHHNDPSQKTFEIGKKLNSYSLEKLMAESKKCTLLCRNCHAEVESDMVLEV